MGNVGLTLADGGSLDIELERCDFCNNGMNFLIYCGYGGKGATLIDCDITPSDDSTIIKDDPTIGRTL